MSHESSQLLPDGTHVTTLVSNETGVGIEDYGQASEYVINPAPGRQP